MSTGRTAISSLPSATPVGSDTALFNDLSASGVSKLATIETLLGLRDNFAEIRNGLLTNTQTGTYSSSATDCDFETNVAESAEVAGGPNEGVVITADQANNRIIIPPGVRVLVEFEAAMFPTLATASDAVTFSGQVALGGTPESQTIGAVGSCANTAATQAPVVMRGSGIIDHSGGSVGYLTLQLFCSASRGCSQDLAMLRARWIKNL